MTLEQLQPVIEQHLGELLTCFKPGAQITLVVVNDQYGDAGVVVSSGDMRRAAQEIEKRLSEVKPQGPESNWDQCLRLAREIPKDKLIKDLLLHMKAVEKKKRRGWRSPLWSVVGEATSHGSGVSSAICEVYLGPGQSE